MKALRCCLWIGAGFAVMVAGELLKHQGVPVGGWAKIAGGGLAAWGFLSQTVQSPSR